MEETASAIWARLSHEGSCCKVSFHGYGQQKGQDTKGNQSTHGRTRRQREDIGEIGDISDVTRGTELKNK